METFLPFVSAAVATPDPSKHVNYTLGMVLGVDDFTQEFAYLSGRDQWLARDTIGYGTVSGLKVRIKTDDKGPGVLVEPGAAVSPRGQFIRVTPAQCAYLNPWLAANKEKLAEHAQLTSPPPGGGDLRLYVVLCYRDCKTEMTPVPGEPCRSEDDLMAASRLADDFRLELRFEAPNQEEENALRDFVAWLNQIEISDASATTLEDFEAAVRQSAKLTSPPSFPWSPPWSPPDFMYGSPPESLSVPSARACEYLRTAFRIWTTELRPRWRPNWFSEWQCCDQKPTEVERPKEECLLLAELDVPLHRVALTDEIKVDDLREIVVDEERRPFLIHLRLLQEWLLCGGTNRDGQTHPGQVVAAGTFNLDGSAVFSFGGLRAERQGSTTVYRLTGPWLVPSRGHYIVKGTPNGAVANTAGLTFEVTGPSQLGAIPVRVTGPAGANVLGFSVEISRYPLA